MKRTTRAKRSAAPKLSRVGMLAKAVAEMRAEFEHVRAFRDETRGAVASLADGTQVSLAEIRTKLEGLNARLVMTDRSAGEIRSALEGSITALAANLEAERQGAVDSCGALAERLDKVSARLEERILSFEGSRVRHRECIDDLQERERKRFENWAKDIGAMAERVSALEQISKAAPSPSRPATFTQMSEWRSYQIQHWLDTVTAAEARALFERGALIEEELERSAR